MAGRQLLRQAAEALHDGGVIAYPTEAVFGLGCDPENGRAVSRLLALKQRSPKHGLILVASEFEQLQHFLAPVPVAVTARMLASWPGPQTWVVPAAASCPLWLTGEHDSIAVRVSAHPVVRALCDAAGMALVSTSANRRGHPPARSALACRMRFGTALDLVVPGKTGDQVKPTAIRDALSGTTIRAA